MPPWLQFVADHKIILWLVLSSGVLSLLTSTVFCSRLLAAMKNFLKSPLVNEAKDKQPFLIPFLTEYDAMLGKTWFRVAGRVVGVIQGLLFIAVSVAGLCFL